MRKLGIMTLFRLEYHYSERKLGIMTLFRFRISLFREKAQYNDIISVKSC